MTLDTTALNRRMTHFDGHDSVWLFGYGSLIWKVDFDYLERRPASIRGWTRRFWQGSHDHRGTPDAPGRVVTLVRDADAICHGMAYRIPPSVFEPLDIREKNGYLRVITTMTFDDNSGADHQQAEGVVYLAGEDNAAYLGHAEENAIARQIAMSHGPSGPNRDYLLNLAAALRELDVPDDHVFALERELQALK